MRSFFIIAKVGLIEALRCKFPYRIKCKNATYGNDTFSLVWTKNSCEKQVKYSLKYKRVPEINTKTCLACRAYLLKLKI